MEKKTVKKINFFHLFKVFKWQAVIYWLTSIVIVIISYVFFTATYEIITSGSKIENYFTELLPTFLTKIFKFPMWTKGDFLSFLAILMTLQIVLLYFSNLQKEKFQIEGQYYVKNRLLDKFRQLTFEERERKKKEINTLVEEDSFIVGKFWNSLYNENFRLIVRLLLILAHFWFLTEFTGKTRQMNGQVVFVSLIWLFLVNLISYLFLWLILRNEKKYKRELTKENSLINRENSKSILIDSMGLSSQYQDKQKSISERNKKLFDSFASVKSLYEIIPEEVINYYPFIILVFAREFAGANASAYFFFHLFSTFSKTFKILIDYGDYSVSLTRVNNFLSLPQKNDNLTGLIITSKINSIVFKNVYFKYSNKRNQALKNPADDFTKKNVSYLLGESTTDKSTILYFKYATSENWILEDYNHNFTTKHLNELSGENGTGKSTILYLLLGMLHPTSGQILINCHGGKVYDLHQDINLQHWREQTVAYCAHDTLIEAGSTGQKQLTNVEQIIANKKAAQIFLFDEADNALDKKNQEEFDQQLKKLLKGNKLVIYTIKL